MSGDVLKRNLPQCPSAEPRFRYYWKMLVEDVVSRENFKKSHLIQLKILCDCLVELDRIVDYLAVSGENYETSGRHGDLIKSKPEVAQRNQLRQQIAMYCKMLGLILAKDTAPSDNEKDEKDDWE